MFTPFSVNSCSLELLRIGEQSIVTFCKIQDETIRIKLIAIGLTTGTYITIEQSFPSLIVKIGNKFSTIDRVTAKAIYVRIINS